MASWLLASWLASWLMCWLSSYDLHSKKQELVGAFKLGARAERWIVCWSKSGHHAAALHTGSTLAMLNGLQRTELKFPS